MEISGSGCQKFGRSIEQLKKEKRKMCVWFKKKEKKENDSNFYMKLKNFLKLSLKNNDLKNLFKNSRYLKKKSTLVYQHKTNSSFFIYKNNNK